MAGVAGLTRLTPAALGQAKAMRDADLNEQVVDALKTATENGTRLSDTTVKRRGQRAVITPWALAERTLGVKPAEARRIQQDLEASGVLRRWPRYGVLTWPGSGPTFHTELWPSQG